jgi:hypothetical protein
MSRSFRSNEVAALMVSEMKARPSSASALCRCVGWPEQQTVRSRRFAEAMRAAGHVYIHSWATVVSPLYHWRTSLNQVDAPRPAKAGKKLAPLTTQCLMALITHGRLGVRDMQRYVRAPLVDLSSTLCRLNARGDIHRVAWERVPNANGAMHPSGIYEYGPGVSVARPGVKNSVFDVAASGGAS